MLITPSRKLSATTSRVITRSIGVLTITNTLVKSYEAAASVSAAANSTGRTGCLNILVEAYNQNGPSVAARCRNGWDRKIVHSSAARAMAYVTRESGDGESRRCV